jgi:hypothetical protein
MKASQKCDSESRHFRRRSTLYQFPGQIGNQLNDEIIARNSTVNPKKNFAD